MKHGLTRFIESYTQACYVFLRFAFTIRQRRGIIRGDGEPEFSNVSLRAGEAIGERSIELVTSEHEPGERSRSLSLFSVSEGDEGPERDSDGDFDGESDGSARLSPERDDRLQGDDGLDGPEGDFRESNSSISCAVGSSRLALVCFGELWSIGDGGGSSTSTFIGASKPDGVGGSASYAPFSSLVASLSTVASVDE